MGSMLMDGTEQTLFENTELGEYSGFIFFDSLKNGDAVTIKIYVRDVEDEAYKRWISDTYIYELENPTVRMLPVIGKVGLKVTAEQTAGTYRTITHMWFKR